MQTTISYLGRKRREIELLHRCLRSKLDISLPDSPTEAADQKFRIAAALRAEQSLRSWSVTETAQPPTQRWRCGAFEFNFGYQRADLTVRGPAIYPYLARQATIYTGSGMSAIAALVTALLQMYECVEVLAARDCYAETRELLQRFAGRVRMLAPCRRTDCDAVVAPARILWLDSCVQSGFFRPFACALRSCDLVVVDTTCFARQSGRICSVARETLAAGIPLVLLRSHAKLDCLGIEYGRLGSVVICAGRDGFSVERVSWSRRLAAHTRDVVRLFGLAPIPIHFPPFVGGTEYTECSVARVASIIRNTRRMARILAARLEGRSTIVPYQHGLYLTIAPHGDPDVDDVRHAAAELAETLAAKGLCVRHAGSFGFDFVAVEWFPDLRRRRNVIRIAGADLPLELADRIAEEVGAWWTVGRRVRRATGLSRSVRGVATA